MENKKIVESFKKSTVMASLQILRGRATTSLDPKLLGVEETGLYEQNLDRIKISFFPKKYEREIKKLQNEARNMLNSIKLTEALGFGTFILKENYEKFSEDMEEIREKYFKVRDSILNDYDKIKATFEDNIREAIMVDGECNKNIKKIILDQFPTKYSIESDFQVFWYSLPIPFVVGNDEDSIFNDTNSVARKIFSNIFLNDVQSLIDYLVVIREKHIEKDVLSEQTLKSLNNRLSRLKKNAINFDSSKMLGLCEMYHDLFNKGLFKDVKKGNIDDLIAKSIIALDEMNIKGIKVEGIYIDNILKFYK